jgi:hypothetical protein
MVKRNAVTVTVLDIDIVLKLVCSVFLICILSHVHVIILFDRLCLSFTSRATHEPHVSVSLVK